MGQFEKMDMTIEEFDAMDGKHIFSEAYIKKKRMMLRELRRQQFVAYRLKGIKVAIAAMAFFVAMPLVANAASNGELFRRIWGNLGKEDIQMHEEVVYEVEKDTSYLVNYPERSFVEVNPQEAEELVGEYVSYEKITKQIDDTTMTILSAVGDGNAAVIEFTLERDEGVNALGYSSFDNEAKGAWFTEESTFWFRFSDSSENIYVDLEKSTGDKLYCYAYLSTGIYGKSLSRLTLEIDEYPCTRGEMIQADEMRLEEIEKNTKKTSVVIPIKSGISKLEYVNDEDGYLSISPISIKIDMNIGLGLTAEEAYDPYNVYYVAIGYKDGTSYIVREHEKNGKHTCDTEIDNTSYACGDLQNNVTYVFNRLVDLENVEYIIVNDSTYHIAQ